MKVKEAASYLRSKNAGPFCMTIDLFFNDRSKFDSAVHSQTLTAETMNSIYGVNDAERFVVENLLVIKFSMSRPFPQGSSHDADMHAGQQYLRVANLEL